MKKLVGLLTIACAILTVVSSVWGGRADTIVIDCSKTAGAFNNIAGGINFWGVGEAQKRFMEEVGTGLYRLKIRLHKVGKRDGRYVNFPWQGCDLTSEEMEEIIKNLNVARSRGGRTMLQIYGVPKWLSLSDDDNVVTNALPNFAKYPPKDHEEWKRLIAATIEALQKLGLGKVDYYEIFGEVNAGSTWYGQMMPCKKMGKTVHGCKSNILGHSTAEVMAEFFKLYKSTAEVIRSIDRSAKVGGLGIIPNPSGIWWTRAFAKYVRVNNVPLDFYSWHWYGIDEALASMVRRVGGRKVTLDLVQRHFGKRLEAQGFSHAEMEVFTRDLYKYLGELANVKAVAVKKPYTFVSSHLRRILNEQELDEIGLFLTEWNVNHAVDRRHDTHYGASFAAVGLMDISASSTDMHNFYSLSTRRSTLPHRAKYIGDYGLFAGYDPCVPKASYNAFKLFRMLGDNGKHLAVKSEGNNIYAIATKDDNGVSVLVTYYIMAKDPEYDMKKVASVRVDNLPFSKQTYRVFRVDGDHSNNFYGSGPELEVTEEGRVRAGFNKRFEIPVYGVLMVRFEKE